MRQIQIGIEVHKAIEAERLALGESENDILMRLLRLKAAASKDTGAPAAGGAAWIKDGVALPAGTQLRVSYSGQLVEGVIEDGRWLIRGKYYDSPSMALIHNVTTAAGSKTNLNGWNHWTVKRPLDSSYRRISDLRALAIKA